MDSRERLRNLSFQPGDIIAGRYEFVRKLGQGGMGMVCLCKDRKDGGREVALKTVPDILRNDDGAVEALRKEYRSMLVLTHDGIVAVRNLEDDEFRYYIVMDYAEGETLESYLKTHRRLGLEVTLEVVRRLAIALDYAHGKGLVHRDVKPGNVMVQIDGNNVKSVKLLDFGLGLHIRESVSHVSGVMTSGTPAYKSPEQWRPDLYDGKLTPRADQYSLAVLAYEMLCGHYPFFDFDLATFPNAVLTVPPKRLDDQPDYVNDALQKALAKKPEDRFENCTAFMKAMTTKPEAKPSVQPETVEPPKSTVSPMASRQMDPKPQLASNAMKTEGKKSKRWIWIVAFVVLIGVLALIAGVSAENNSSKSTSENKSTENEESRPLIVNSYQQKEDRVVELNGVKMVLKHIKAGTFMMGSPTSEDDRDSDERQYRVTLTKDYWLGETEVTQEQYRAVMGKNPSFFLEGGTYPVENVSWADAMAFCERLTKAERANGNLPDGYEYTLPTEAQWEHAARGGQNNGQYHVYSGSDEISSVAWYYTNSGSLTHPVGQKKPNELGLYDMSGNVWEWCRDWYGAYPVGSITDPAGPSSGSCRVLRGGSWYYGAGDCRSASRYYYYDDPVDRGSDVGFRVALASVQ